MHLVRRARKLLRWSVIAGVGASITYFFDQEHGAGRRAHLARSASELRRKVSKRHEAHGADDVDRGVQPVNIDRAGVPDDRPQDGRAF